MTRIILIGMERSGTKWLSNLLCNHTEIIGVQHPEHGGIIETNMFNAFPEMFPNLKRIENYMGFVEVFSSTDFNKSCGIEKEFFYQIKPPARSFSFVFVNLMDEFARRNNKSFWIQKTSPKFAGKFLLDFPETKVIIIKRSIVDTLLSKTLLHFRRGIKTSLVKSIILYHYQDKLLNHYMKTYNSILVQYKELLDQTEQTMIKVLRELGLDYNSEILNLKFARNTSFNSETRQIQFSKIEVWLIKIMSLFLKYFPISMLKFVYNVWGHNNTEIVGGTFRELIKKHNVRG